MDILRRNTDYALRAMVNLAGHWQQKPAPTKEVANKENISYHLACKLMQKLHNAGVVKSSMGPKGGFGLSREPSKIDLLEIIEAIQGPLSLNRCLLPNACRRRKNCTVSGKLAELQEYIDSYLRGITLDKLLQSRDAKGKKKAKNPKRKKR